MTKNKMLKAMSDCVVDMDDEKAADIANEYLAAGHDPLEGILSGLIDGMQRSSDLYEAEEYYIPELLLCSDAMYSGLDILKPHIQNEELGRKGKVVIGVVRGDTHDIGKNLVKIMLEAAGYETFDVGRDVPLQNFIDKVKEENADILALSTLMSTAMMGMEDIIKLLEENNIRDKVKVIIGGAPVSWSFARKIGADGYSKDAVEAVSLVNDLMKEKNAEACNGVD